MKTLRVHNFGPLRDLEIEVRDFMIFIGPQASGKSTLAKLIELSETASSILFKTVQTYPVRSGLKAETVWDQFRQGFLDNLLLRFHNAYWNSSSNIQIHYTSVYPGANVDISIAFIHGSPEVNLQIDGAEDAVESLIELKKEFDSLKSTQLSELSRTTLDLRYLREKENLMRRVADDLFGVSYAALVYIPAGRTRFAEEAWMEEQGFFNALESPAQTYSASIKEDHYVRQFLAQRNHRTDNNINRLPEQSSDQSEELRHFDLKTREILKGKIVSPTATTPESIELESGDKIPLSKASSGQQEAAEVLMELREHMLPDSAKPAWVMIEEPETHLYPTEQKAMAEAISLFLNSYKGNKVLITTHSPYLLAAIDNLILADSIAKSNPNATENVETVIGKHYWIPFENVTAYYFSSKGELKDMRDPERNSIGGVEMEDDANVIAELFDNLIELKYPL